LSAPARSTEHLRWLPAKSNRCATSAACLGRSPKVAAETAAERKFLTTWMEESYRARAVCDGVRQRLYVVDSRADRNMAVSSESVWKSLPE